jgi:hypothetical protein
MQYTKRTVIVSQSRISEAEEILARQRRVVERLENARHPAEHAVALLLIMEQSLLSMRRFLATLERDLERALGVAEKPLRTKAARHREKANNAQLAQYAGEALRGDGGDASVVDDAPKPASELTRH